MIKYIHPPDPSIGARFDFYRSRRLNKLERYIPSPLGTFRPRNATTNQQQKQQGTPAKQETPKGVDMAHTHHYHLGT